MPGSAEIPKPFQTSLSRHGGRSVHLRVWRLSSRRGAASAAAEEWRQGTASDRQSLRYAATSGRAPGQVVEQGRVDGRDLAECGGRGEQPQSEHLVAATSAGRTSWRLSLHRDGAESRLSLYRRSAHR